jgi:hypothetical protein
MRNRTLALALAGLMVAARGQAEHSKWPSASLEQRAAERGPIRTQLEAALAVPAIEITARVVEVEEARAAALGPPSSPPPRSRIPWGVWVLVGLLSLYAALLEWGRGWSNM